MATCASQPNPPKKTSDFCIDSPSAAQVALMCTPCRRQNPKRVGLNHMAHPKGTNPGHIIYQKKKASQFPNFQRVQGRDLCFVTEGGLLLQLHSPESRHAAR